MQPGHDTNVTWNLQIHFGHLRRLTRMILIIRLMIGLGDAIEEMVGETITAPARMFSCRYD